MFLDSQTDTLPPQAAALPSLSLLPLFLPPSGCSHSWIQPSSCLAVGLLLSWEFTCLPLALMRRIPFKICVTWREPTLCPTNPLFTAFLLVYDRGIALQPCFLLPQHHSQNICCVWPFFLCSAGMWLLPSSHLPFASQKINYCGGTISVYYIFFSRKKNLNHPPSSRLGAVTCLGLQLRSYLLPRVSQSVKCLLVT